MMLSHKQLRAIEARWKEWLPSLLLDARNHASNAYPVDKRMAQLKATHLARVTEILQSGLGGPSRGRLWRTIRKDRLDNPLWSDIRFGFELGEALRRSDLITRTRNRNRKVGVQSTP